MFRYIGYAGLFVLAACTQAQRAQYEYVGESAAITCYTADGHIIYQGHSTGLVTNESNSDGWEWIDSNTKSMVEVTGTCLFIYGAVEQEKQP